MKNWIIAIVVGMAILCLGSMMDEQCEFLPQSCAITNCGDTT